MAITPSFFFSFNPSPHSCVSGRISIQTSTKRLKPACGSVNLVMPDMTRCACFFCQPSQKRERGRVWKKTITKKVMPIKKLKASVHLTTTLNLLSRNIRRKKHSTAALTSTSPMT